MVTNQFALIDGIIEEMPESWQDPAYLEKQPIQFNDFTCIEELDTYRRFAYPTRRFIENSAQEIGAYVTEEQRAKLAKPIIERRDFSWAIAQKMEKCGIKAFSESQNVITKIGLFSGQYQIQPAFRRCNFIPDIAHEKRNQRLRLLHYYLSREQNQNCRDGVVTSGKRCKAENITDRKKLMDKEFNKLYEKPWFYSCAEIVVKSFEIGSPFQKETGIIQKDDDGNVTFHPHYHFVLRFTKWLSKKQYKEFCELFRKNFTSFADINQKIRKPEEFCKYIVKPCDLIRLPDYCFKQIFDQLHGKQTFFCLGTFGQLKKSVKKADKVPCRPCESNRYRWTLEPNPNSNHGLKKAPTQKDILKQFAVCNEDLEAIEAIAKIEPSENAILAILPPSAEFTSLKEPIILLLNKSVTWREDIKKDIRVQELIAGCKDQYEAGKRLCEALSLEVHTTPIISDAPSWAIQRNLIEIPPERPKTQINMVYSI